MIRRTYDEPTAHRHRVARVAPPPDRRRPGWTDPRVLEMVCGQVGALVGLPEHRPPVLTNCSGCFDG